MAAGQRLERLLARPDEWLLAVEDRAAADLERELRGALHGRSSVADVTGAQTQVELSGAAVGKVLQRSSPYDFHPCIFPPGRCAQTVFTKATALVVAKERERSTSSSGGATQTIAGDGSKVRQPSTAIGSDRRLRRAIYAMPGLCNAKDVQLSVVLGAGRGLCSFSVCQSAIRLSASQSQCLFCGTYRWHSALMAGERHLPSDRRGDRDAPVLASRREMSSHREACGTSPRESRLVSLRHHKSFWLAPTVLLAAALLPWPYGYYQLLRLAVCVVSGWIAYEQWKHDDGVSGWVVAFAGMALLYNPAMPVHLSREIWSVLNLASAALFLGHLGALSSLVRHRDRTVPRRTRLQRSRRLLASRRRPNRLKR